MMGFNEFGVEGGAWAWGLAQFSHSNTVPLAPSRLLSFGQNNRQKTSYSYVSFFVKMAFYLRHKKWKQLLSTLVR